jgi:hypothetical protein
MVEELLDVDRADQRLPLESFDYLAVDWYVKLDKRALQALWQPRTRRRFGLRAELATVISRGRLDPEAEVGPEATGDTETSELP